MTAIDGSWELLRHGMRPVPFGTRVRVRLGAPIPRVPGEDPLALLARIRRGDSRHDRALASHRLECPARARSHRRHESSAAAQPAVPA